MVAYSFKKRFVTAIRTGLGFIDTGEDHRGNGIPSELLSDNDFIPPVHPKRQTIRANRKHHVKPGQVVHLYCGMRTKDCFKIGEALCTKVQGIVIVYDRDKRGTPQISIKLENEDHVLSAPELIDFARRDGFENQDEMAEFWLKEHPNVRGVFRGRLIEWEPIL
jgi:hypothetical protein